MAGPGIAGFYKLNDVRWADDFLVTANAREVLETPSCRRSTPLAARGVRLSPHKTSITPLSQGFDLGQTIRKHARPHGTPATPADYPQQGSVQAITAKVTTLCQQAARRYTGTTHRYPEPHTKGLGELTATSSVARRLYNRQLRMAPAVSMGQTPPPEQTGCWITTRYFPHQPGDSWRFTGQRPANRSFVDKRRSNPSVTSRSRATPTHATPLGALFPHIGIDS
jgi:hypothetical protein